MEDQLLIFISSVMSNDIDNLSLERKIVKKAIEQLKFTKPWAFEYSPASSMNVQESYLSKVRACDIFIIILNSEITPAVQMEYNTACECNRPKLVFIKENSQRDDMMNHFIKSIGVKWKSFSSPEALYYDVRDAIISEIVRSYKIANSCMDTIPNMKITPVDIEITSSNKIIQKHPVEKIKKDIYINNLIPIDEYRIDNRYKVGKK